jgi:hypothetical protein
MDSCAEQEIKRLIGALESLVDGELAVEQLADCGPAAIPYLREFLLHGRVKSIPQPRMRAVEVLARMGAKAVLLEYLTAAKLIPDRQLCMSEEAVENTAARKLSCWRDDEVFETLLAVCRRHLLPGAVESLTPYERTEAMPCFDRALEDDFCRAAAEEGFRRLGPRAGSALVLSAITPLPGAEEESPSSLRRRRSALALLAEIGIDEENWLELRALLSEADPEIAVRMAQLAQGVATVDERRTAAAHLLSALPELPWYLWEDAAGALIALAPESAPIITGEIGRRSAAPAGRRAADEVLRMLLRIQSKLAT